MAQFLELSSIFSLLFYFLRVSFFFSIWVFFYKHSRITGLQGKGEGISFSLPLPPGSQTLRHQLGDYCRELTSAHSQQPDLNREPLVSERKSLTTKLRALKLRAWVSLSFLQEHFRLNIYYGSTLLHFSSKRCKNYKIKKKMFTSANL